MGPCVVAGYIGDVWIRVERHGAVAIGRSSKGRGTWHLTALFVMRGMLPDMLLRVCRECVHFVNYSACLVVELGANMLGVASVICVSMGSCEVMAFAISPSLSSTLCLGTLCLGTLCLGTLCLWGGTYDTLCRSFCGRIHLCTG